MRVMEIALGVEEMMKEIKGGVNLYRNVPSNFLYQGGTGIATRVKNYKETSGKLLLVWLTTQQRSLPTQQEMSSQE